MSPKYVKCPEPGFECVGPYKSVPNLSQNAAHAPTSWEIDWAKI